jgi:hypothetical protein
MSAPPLRERAAATLTFTLSVVAQGQAGRTIRMMGDALNSGEPVTPLQCSPTLAVSIYWPLFFCH